MFWARITSRCDCWEAISVCHSVAALCTSWPSTLFGSTRSGLPLSHEANAALKSSTATRNSAVPGCGALRGNPPPARKMRSSSADM